MDHTIKNGRKTSGQFDSDRSFGVLDVDLLRRGSGTEGGFVVERRAAKYKHSAGPGGAIKNYKLDDDD